MQTDVVAEKMRKVTVTLSRETCALLAVHAAYTGDSKSKVVNMALEAFCTRFTVEDLRDATG